MSVVWEHASPKGSAVQDAPAVSSRLRVALVVPAGSRDPRAWHRAAAEVLAPSRVELCALVAWPAARYRPEASSPARWIVRTVERLDRALHECPLPFSEDLSGLFRDKPVLDFSGADVEDGTASGWQALRELDVDVIATLVHDPSVLRMASAARCGVWWCGPVPLPSADLQRLHDFHATADGLKPVTECIWRMTSASPEPQMLQEATTRRLSKVSMEKNAQAVRTLRAALWERALAAVTRDVPAAESVSGPDAPLVSRTAPDAGLLNIGRSILRVGVRQVLHRATHRSRRLTWHVGIRKFSSSRMLDAEGYQWVAAPDGQWIADPFLVEWRGRTFLFVENFSLSLGRGQISCAEVHATGALDPFQVVLDAPHHLSYPHVFQHEGEMFMVPESGANGTVDLYQATDFPYRWKYVKTLYNGAAFDTTVLNRDGRFWFFTSLIEDRERLASRLMLFSAAELDAAWEPHPASPLTMDARFARCAGALITIDGGLVRPAQDCSEAYGGAMNFRRIEVLNGTQYREVPVGVLASRTAAGPVGPHTYARAGNWEAVDRLDSAEGLHHSSRGAPHDGKP